MLYHLCTIDSLDSPLSATPSNLLVANMATKRLCRILYHAVVGMVAISSDIQNGKGVKEFISVCSKRLGWYQ